MSSALDPKRATQVLVVGEVGAADQLATMLEPDGVTTIRMASGRDALSQVPTLSPDVVVLGGGYRDDPSDGEVVQELKSRAGARLAVVVIGDDQVSQQNADPGRVVDDVKSALARDYLPADVSVTQLADHVRSRLDQPAEAPPRRPAMSGNALTEEIRRELHRSGRARRQGVLAAVSVAELAQLHRRLGSQAERALAAAFEEWVGQDADVLEQHSVRSSGGFFLLMPETDAVAGRERLRRLVRRMADTVIEISGENVHITPVIGYVSFTGSESAQDVEDQAGVALQDASQHLDLLPVRYTPTLAAADVAVPAYDRLLAVLERLRSPVQIAFTATLLLCLPFIVYVIVSFSGFDLTRVTYPIVAVVLFVTAVILWVECFRAVGTVDVPAAPIAGFPTSTAIIAAYLPNEAATIVDTVANQLAQDYPGRMQIILAYNSPKRLPIEDTLEQMAADDPRLLLLRVEASTSKAQNVNAALAHVQGEFVGVFDADHHPVPGSFARAWRWLAAGHDIVQGHCVVRNGEASWVARLVAVEFETVYAVSHPGRARLHGFGIFGGSNGYWRTSALRQIRMQGAMLTEDIDSSMRSLLDGFSIVSDPGLLSTELAPTTIQALWNQRMRWAQGWTQTALRHLGPALKSSRLTARQKVGAAFLLGWTQLVPWVTVQVIPILAFSAWRTGSIGDFNFLIPLFVLLTIFTFSVGVAQTVFAYLLSDPTIRRHRGWFILFAIHSMLWFGEFKNVIARVAQLKELIGERQWRVTPRSAPIMVETSRATGTTVDLQGNTLAS
jgi:cellulose synthase/poly-beta-1,6-N-acetylglucosamine synthase-like glycosyltransferase/DNA-binding NarL/FixJ family response regulator